MGLDIVARAEPSIDREDLSCRLRRALGPSAGWRELQDGVAVDLGPADPLLVELREGALLARARTTPWGPGYHQRVSEALDALGAALPGGWSSVRDATGYFQHRRRSDLCRSFLEWGHTLWSDDARVAEGGLRVGLAAEGPLEVPAGLVATPTGFKGRRWVRTTRAALHRARRSRRPDRPARAAREAFLWWCAAPDAFDLVQLGRALCASDVIWRPVSGQDDPEQDVARRRALDCFEGALTRDPAAPVPLAELKRLYELTGRHADAERVAAPPGEGFWGGYREGWIRLPIGRWTIAVPGWLRGTVATDGHDVFWDDEMTVHVTVGRGPRRGFSPRVEAARHVDLLAPSERARARVEVLEGRDVRGYAVVVPTPEIATRDALIQGLVAHEHDRVGFTVVARSAAARDLGLRFGRCLRPA